MFLSVIRQEVTYEDWNTLIIKIMFYFTIVIHGRGEDYITFVLVRNQHGLTAGRQVCSLFFSKVYARTYAGSRTHFAMGIS